jgi:hypothetical protein
VLKYAIATVVGFVITGIAAAAEAPRWVQEAALTFDATAGKW